MLPPFYLLHSKQRRRVTVQHGPYGPVRSEAVGWTSFCTQNCLHSSWHMFNKEQEPLIKNKNWSIMALLELAWVDQRSALPYPAGSWHQISPLWSWKGGQHSGRLLGSNNAWLALRDSKLTMKTSSTAPHTAAEAWTFDTGRTGPCFHVVLLLTRPSECQGRTCDSSDLATFFIFYCPSPCELWPRFPVPHLEDWHTVFDFHIFLASVSWPPHCRAMWLAHSMFFLHWGVPDEVAGDTDSLVTSSCFITVWWKMYPLKTGNS